MSSAGNTDRVADAVAPPHPRSPYAARVEGIDSEVGRMIRRFSSEIQVELDKLDLVQDVLVRDVRRGKFHKSTTTLNECLASQVTYRRNLYRMSSRLTTTLNLAVDMELMPAENFDRDMLALINFAGTDILDRFQGVRKNKKRAAEFLKIQEACMDNARAFFDSCAIVFERQSEESARLYRRMMEHKVCFDSQDSVRAEPSCKK